MPDITIPIPHQSGTVSDSSLSTHYCDLGTKFIHVFLQNNPNYVYAYVSNHSDLKSSATFTDVNATARAIFTPSTPIPAPSSQVALRLWKLSERRALLMMHRTMYVLQVEDNDDITVRSAMLPNFGQTPLQGSGYNYQSSGTVYGALFMGWTVRENVVWFFNRSSTGSIPHGYNIQAIEYNPGSDSLSFKTIIGGTLNQSTGNIFVHPSLVTIPGSTKRLFSTRVRVGGGTGFGPSTIITTAHLIDSQTDEAIDAPAMVSKPGAVLMIVPLSENRMLGFSDSRTYYTWENNAWSTNSAFFGANTGTNYLYHGEALDENHFLLLSIGGTQELTSNMGTLPIRIGRFVDATFGQTASWTTTNDGALQTLTSYPQADQPWFVKLGTDTFVTYGRGATTGAGSIQPVIRVLNRPGA